MIQASSNILSSRSSCSQSLQETDPVKRPRLINQGRRESTWNSKKLSVLGGILVIRIGKKGALICKTLQFYWRDYGVKNLSDLFSSLNLADVFPEEMMMCRLPDLLLTWNSGIKCDLFRFWLNICLYLWQLFLKQLQMWKVRVLNQYIHLPNNFRCAWI